MALYAEVCRSFLLCAMTKEVVKDTLAWLMQVDKPFSMTVTQFHAQIQKSNQLIPYMPMDKFGTKKKTPCQRHNQTDNPESGP